MPWGRSLLTQNVVQPTRVSADGSPFYKAGGVVIDWTNVAALGSDTTYPDGSIIRSGQKVLRYGQVMAKETGNGTVQTLTGTATGGTFTLTLTRPDTSNPVTTAVLNFNATAAQILAALQAVLAPGQVLTVTGGALGAAPAVVTFATAVGLATVNGALLTGGTVTNALTAAGLTGGYFGPYDPGASDGRQNLNRGDCFVCDEFILQTPTGGVALGPTTDQTGGMIEGGLVFIDRILQSGVAAASLALGPTLANLTTAFPTMRFTRD